MVDLLEAVKAANGAQVCFEIEKQQLIDRRKRSKENVDKAGEKMRMRYDNAGRLQPNIRKA